MNTDFVAQPNNLESLLYVCDVEDIDILVDYITDKGEGRITLADDVCKRLVGCKNAREYSVSDRRLISFEIRRFGGNTLTNWYRETRNDIEVGSLLDKILPDTKYTVGYDEVVRDVANHLKVSVNAANDVPTMEDGILRKLLAQTFESMTPEERQSVLDELNIKDLSVLKPLASGALIAGGKMAGFVTYKMALIVANAIAKAILGRGLSLAANRLLTRALSTVLGPIGWILTGLWTIADMASPAYRVTVPCVVQVAYMRQKALVAAYAANCPHCDAPNQKESKFCSECGQPMSGKTTTKTTVGEVEPTKVTL